MLHKKTTIFLLKAVLIALTFYIIDFPFINARIDDYLVREDPLKLAGYLLQVILFIALLLFFSISKKLIKNIFIVVFLINSIGYLTYYYATSIPLVFSDFIILFDAKAEIGNAYSAYSTSFFHAVLIHIPFIVVYFLYPSLSLKWKGSLITLSFYLVIILVFVNTLFKTEGRGLIGRPGFLVPTAQGIVYGAAVLNSKINQEHLDIAPRDDYQLYEVKQNDIKTIVMVIDESVNWDMIDLTSHLGVTPSLTAYPNENIVNFEKAVSYANCSDVSNASLRKFVRYGEEEGDFLQDEIIYLWSVAKHAGFEPYLLDLQRDGFNHNYFTSKEIDSINLVPVKGMPDYEVVDVISRLISDTSAHDKKFILVIKEGAHFPYEPMGEPIFTPDMPTTSMKQSSLEEIFNSYKNRVFYQTNAFFDEVLEKLPFQNDLVMIYTSDHGQSFEKLASAKTHCNSKDPSITEAVVPLLVIGPENAINSVVVNEIQASDKVKSHYLIPAMLMSYMGYESDDIDRFTQFTAVLDPVNSNRFVYSKVIPLFTEKALSLELDDDAVKALSHQKTQ